MTQTTVQSLWRCEQLLRIWDQDREGKKKRHWLHSRFDINPQLHKIQVLLHKVLSYHMQLHDRKVKDVVKTWNS